MAKETKSSIWCRMKKGWTAYVRGYKTYTKNYEDINWDYEPEGKKEEIVQTGAIVKRVIKF